MLIGIDHGFYNMKTVNHVFTSGVTKFDYPPPVTENVLKYDDAYYFIGGKHLYFNPDKLRNEDYFILTLAAIAMEIRTRCPAEGKQNYTVTLAVGTPFRRLGTETSDLKKYLFQKRNVTYEFEGQSFAVRIGGVTVYPQGLSAVTWFFHEHKELDLPPSALIADLGGGTFDLIPLVRGKPGKLSEAASENFGMIRIINRVKDEVETVCKFGIDDADVEQLIRDPNTVMADRYKETAVKTLRDCAGQITGRLTEAGINPDTTAVIWVGGGSDLIRNYGTYDKQMTLFIDDICANAKGYELLYKVSHDIPKEGSNE